MTKSIFDVYLIVEGRWIKLKEGKLEANKYKEEQCRTPSSIHTSNCWNYKVKIEYSSLDGQIKREH